MKKSIEVKAMNKENAIKRALNILDATSEQLIEVVVKQKPKSFLGLFNKEGIFEVHVETDLEIIAKMQKEKKELERKELEKKEQEKKEIQKKELEKKQKEQIKKEQVKKDEPKKLEIKKDVKKEEPKKDIKVTKKPEEKMKKDPKVEIKKEKNDISKEDIKDLTLEIQERTSKLIESMGLDLTFDIERLGDRSYTVCFKGKDKGIIIGKKGKTLNSFEYILNIMIKNCRIEVDVEDFKEKRNLTLRDLAEKMALKVIKTGKTVRLNPMPPRERKIIHEILNTHKELDTYSEGRDPKRFIVIKRKK